MSRAVVEDRSILSRSAPPPDAVLTYGPNPEGVADLRSARVPAAGRPVVVLVHGGFWRPQFDRAQLQPMAAALATAGWSTLLPEYRRHPGHPDDTVADVHAAVRAARGLPEVGDGRIVLAGHSAGGHLVLQAAAALGRDVAGVVALAPVADLLLAQDLGLGGDAVRAFLGGDARDRSDLDPARMPAPTARTAVVQGRDDAIVPPAVSASYCRQQPSAELIEVDGGHFGLIDPVSAAWPAVLAALEGVSR
jgi:acetyl esterase/lipase